MTKLVCFIISGFCVLLLVCNKAVIGSLRTEFCLSCMNKRLFMRFIVSLYLSSVIRLTFRIKVIEKY